MIKIFANALLISSFALSIANAYDKIVYLENTDIINLQIENPEIKVAVQYPISSISGICGLDIVVDTYYRHLSIEKLLNQVELLSLFNRRPANYKIINDTRVVISLSEAYVDGIILRTKDGESLKTAIEQTLDPSRKVVIMPRSCI